MDLRVRLQGIMTLRPPPPLASVGFSRDPQALVHTILSPHLTPGCLGKYSDENVETPS